MTYNLDKEVRDGFPKEVVFDKDWKMSMNWHGEAEGGEEKNLW